MPILIALGVALAISLLSNVWLFNSRDSALEKVAQFETANQTLTTASKTCSDSVDNLAKEGVKRRNETIAAFAKEAARIKVLQQDALTVLNAKPIDPNDLCKSVLVYLQSELKKERR